MSEVEPYQAGETLKIPLVRLALIQPFVDELDERGINTDAVLVANGLVRSTVADTDVFVPNIVTHRFFEDAARAADDPYLGVAVGEKLDISAWVPYFDKASPANNLTDLLVRLIMAGQEEASMTRHRLEVGEEFSSFREIRVGDQEVACAQADSFTAAYFLNLLKKAVGQLWVGKQVLVTVYDPGTVPRDYLGTGIAGGDHKGIRVRFPSTWLVQPLDSNALMEPYMETANRANLPVGFLNELRKVLYVEIANGDVGTDHIAGLIGISRQSLQRKLRTCGTTLSAEIARLRKERAIDELTQTAKSVADVAEAVGFNNPTSFTRAFKSWTGKSPRQYRNEFHGDEPRGE